MKFALFIFIALTVEMAVAGVYKWTDSAGRIQYSDRPVRGAEAQKIPLPTQERRAQQGSDEQDGQSALYDEVEIVAPEQNQTVRSDSGAVNLSIIIIPPLMDDHRIQVLIDGTPISGTIDGPQSSVNGVSFGSHSIQVKILDYQDEPVATSAAVNFHLRKPLPPSATID